MRIFVASTGRCGTLFFSEMFKEMTAVSSFHEPQPWCVGKTMEQVNDLDKVDAEVGLEMDAKVSQVKKDTIDGFYFESSQMFIKSYALRMLEEFRDVACIYLWRNPVDVLISHFKKCTEQESDWILQGHWKKNCLRTQRPMSFAETVLWQWYEIQERYLRLKPRFKRTYEFDFRRIDDMNEWGKLFSKFGVPVKAKGKPPNYLRKNNIQGDETEVLKKIMLSWDKPSAAFKMVDDRTKQLRWAISDGERLYSRFMRTAPL